jgi:predicted N-formylglutamate amidohydrolase
VSPDTPPVLLLTCEHAGNEVPPQHAHLFTGHEPVLGTHRGYDLGAYPVAQRLAARLAAPLIACTFTRLLIDLNRSEDHPDLFSEFSRTLPEPERDAIRATHYTPHRETVTRTAAALIAAGHTVLHVGVHSCTDILHGKTRDLDIALLFDEDREQEHGLCQRWRDNMQALSPALRYPFNEPYRGSDDGLTTTLRARFAPAAYLGIEIELRQGFVRSPVDQRTAADLLADALAPLILV